MTVANEPLWYVVHTHPREEFKALSHLRRQNYQVYLPRYAKMICHARKSGKSHQAVFSSISLCEVGSGDQWLASHPFDGGVNDIVCFENNRPLFPPA